MDKLHKEEIEKLTKIGNSLDKKFGISKSRYYDKEGNNIGMGDWCNLFEDFNYRKIDLYENCFIRISTVWLGLDHSFKRNTPLIFETMVFPKFSYSEIDCRRYSTLENAKLGHIELVKKYKYRIDLVILVMVENITRPIKYKIWNIQSNFKNKINNLKRRAKWLTPQKNS